MVHIPTVPTFTTKFSVRGRGRGMNHSLMEADNLDPRFFASVLCSDGKFISAKWGLRKFSAKTLGVQCQMQKLVHLGPILFPKPIS